MLGEEIREEYAVEEWIGFERFKEWIEGSKIKHAVYDNRLTDGVEEVYFINDEDEVCKIYHDQDCCEIVYVDKIHGNLSDLNDSEITFVEEFVFDGNDKCGTSTYSLYRFDYKKEVSNKKRSWTEEGQVTIQWLGESNGYYDETVGMALLKRRGK